MLMLALRAPALYVLLHGSWVRFIRERQGRKAKGIGMKTGFLASAAIVLALFSVPAQAAPEWTTILMEKVVDRTPDQTWSKIGPYCAIATWLKVSCVVTTGNQVSVGTIRRLNGRTDEIIVAATPYSYSYAQPLTDVQPESPIFYHGTLAVEPVDRSHSKLIYTLIWNQTAVGDAAAQAAAREGRKTRFQAAVDKMAAAANAP
jgi:hypothetical protein